MKKKNLIKMMKSYISLSYIFLLLILSSSCKHANKDLVTVLSVQNNSGMDKMDALISIDKEALEAVIGSHNFNDINMDIPFQLDDTNKDGKPDKLLILTDLKEGEKVILDENSLFKDSVMSFPKRTQAEISHKIGGTWKGREYIGGTFKNVNHLKVPKEHTDHSWFIRYEGPGWESDLVGYRFYLDWRNATDIFGKTTADMVLQNVGQDGFDSYHELSDWGMDILKVGNSLGIGAIGTWMDNKAERVAQTDSLESSILSNGIIQSKVETKYYGWAFGDYITNLTATLSINAGDRLTHCWLDLEKTIPNICTGIVKHDAARLMKGNSDEKWNYLATYGKQTLNDDNLGMVIFFKNEDFIEFNEDEDSYVVILKGNQKADYYFGAAWEKEPNGITSEEEFTSYVNLKLDNLNNPITIN